MLNKFFLSATFSCIVLLISGATDLKAASGESVTPYHSKLSRKACRIEMPEGVFEKSQILRSDIPASEFASGWHLFPDKCSDGQPADSRETSSVRFSLLQGTVQDEFRVSRPALAIGIAGKILSGRFEGPITIWTETRSDTTGTFLRSDWLSSRARLVKSGGVIVEHRADAFVSGGRLYFNEAAYKAADSGVEKRRQEARSRAPTFAAQADPVVQLEDNCSFRVPYALLGPGGILRSPVDRNEVTGVDLFVYRFKQANSNTLCRDNNYGESVLLKVYLEGDRTSRGCKTSVNFLGSSAGGQLIGKIKVGVHSSSASGCSVENDVVDELKNDRLIWNYKGRYYLSTAALRQAPGGSAFYEADGRNDRADSAKMAAAQRAVLGGLGAITTGEAARRLGAPEPSASAQASNLGTMQPDSGKVLGHPVFKITCDNGKTYRVYRKSDGYWDDAGVLPFASPLSTRDATRVIKARCRD